jgi:hypothetical protein
MKLPIVPTVVLAALGCVGTTTTTTTRASTGEVDPDKPPALTAIKEADLRRDLEGMAGDAMRGREAGTLDELRASMWVADRAREAGLEPAGDDGTFFQFWPMRRMRLAPQTRVTVGSSTLVLWKDVVITSLTEGTGELPLVFVDERAGEAVDVRGKAVAALVMPPANPPAPDVSLRAWRYARAALNERSRALLQQGAAAVILVSDSLTEAGFDFLAATSARGSYGLDTLGGADRPRAQPPVMLVRRAMLPQLRSADRISFAIVAESFVYPSVNIVGRIRGTDARLREEYVEFSGHQDHDGVRFPVDGDSIWNGADDNATTSVAMLAIARAWKQQPGRRSALFVWHGAEERGLLGSRWYVMKPTVPLTSIVAVLNGDMLGRNNPDSASLMGIQPPHRNSTALVNMALAANAMTGKFHLDSIWDRPTHREGWYFRSDHLPYARANIPAVFFSTNLHPDYHTPRDEPKTIDVPKLTRMAQWMYATGWLVGNADQRPAIDPGFKLER